MAPHTSPEPHLPDNITVTRDPGGAYFTVSVDGHVLPWMLDASAGVRTGVSADSAPGVTLTILARSVTVEDRMLIGARVAAVHDHHDEDEDDDAA